MYVKVAVFLFILSFNVFAEEDSCIGLFRKIYDRNFVQKIRSSYQNEIERMHAIAKKHSDSIQLRPVFKYDTENIYRLDIPSSKQPPQGRIIITAGIHGNEAITTTVAIDLIEFIAKNEDLRNMYDFVIYPNMNPHGLLHNNRYLSNGVDYNRTFKPGFQEPITKLFMNSVSGEEFDLGLDLHEAYKKHGFFTIRAQRDDDDYIDQVLSQLDQNMLLKSPDGTYPYEVPSTKNPAKTAYVLTSPGVTASFSEGTLKSFFRSHLNARASHTLESPGQVEMHSRRLFYQQLVISFLTSFHRFY